MTTKLTINAFTAGPHHKASLFLGQKGLTLPCIGQVAFDAKGHEFASLLAVLRIGADRSQGNFEVEVDDDGVDYDTSTPSPIRAAPQLAAEDMARKSIAALVEIATLMFDTLKVVREDQHDKMPASGLRVFDDMLEVAGATIDLAKRTPLYSPKVPAMLADGSVIE